MFFDGDSNPTGVTNPLNPDESAAEAPANSSFGLTLPGDLELVAPQDEAPLGGLVEPEALGFDALGIDTLRLDVPERGVAEPDEVAELDCEVAEPDEVVVIAACELAAAGAVLGWFVELELCEPHDKARESATPVMVWLKITPEWTA